MDLSREAGAMLMRYFGRSFDIQLKGRINLVTEADIASEKLIAERIQARYPKHHLLAEEGYGHEGKSDFKWIVDPLDGTTNFAHGYPCFCVSIGLEHCGQMLLGVVFNPILNELFYAVRGGGAFLNSRRVAVSKTDSLQESLLCTGFPYDIRTSPENNLDHFVRFITQARAVRRDGAAALDLCYLAAGRFDGFWELKLSPWDTAAGVLIIEEAGGRITDFAGRAFNNYTGQLAASNCLIHEEMLRLLVP
jgi:myo-inositol-1(or 4)-monophosphatase